MLTTVPSRLQGINILFLLSNQTDLSNGNLIETKTYPVLIIIFPLQNSYFHKIWTLKNTVPCFGLAVILWLFKWTYLCNCNSFSIFLTLKFRRVQKRWRVCTCLHASDMGCFFFLYYLINEYFSEKKYHFFHFGVNQFLAACKRY